MGLSELTKEEYEALQKEWRDEFLSIVYSPEARKRGEEMHKALSKMTVEDYMRVIT